MSFIKLILAHERQENLIKAFKAYLQVFNIISSEKPDIIVIIDSSEDSNEYIQNLKYPWLIYRHAPFLSIPSKIKLFINDFGLKSEDIIDLCSDEDLYFRKNFCYKKPYSFQQDSCFGWIMKKASDSSHKDILHLRDLSRVSSHDSSTISELDKYKFHCKFSHPEGFWSLMTGDLFILRNDMFSFLRKTLPDNSSKIDEIFINVLQAFAVSVQGSDAIRFRNTDNSKALRFSSKSSKESAMKASFASIYNSLRQNYSSELNACLDLLCSLINQLLRLRGSLLQTQSSFVDSLIKLSINSYSYALSYDFNNRSYVFGPDSIYINEQLGTIDARRFELRSSSGCLFNSLSVPPLMFTSGLCSSFFAFADPNSPFAFGRNCEIFASVPKSYWGF